MTMQPPAFTRLTGFSEYSASEMVQRSQAFYEQLSRRRTVRQFANRSVPRAVIDNCLRTAGTAPSGANRQPWHFVVVSSPALKSQIREAAEREEQRFYHELAPPEWLAALAPLGTDEHKPFLEVAPYLIIIFAQAYGLDEEEQTSKNYYVTESVGIATGFLITAVHHAGLVTLTHTPSPMEFLSRLLDRPRNERPFLILAVGYPAADAQVPVIRRKDLPEIATFV